MLEYCSTPSLLSPKVLWFLHMGFQILQASFWGETKKIL